MQQIKSRFQLPVVSTCGWAVLFFLLNFGLKLLYLGDNSLGGDEPFSVYHAQMPVPDIVRQLSLGNNPPLWEIILHFWINVFGISESSVRFLPLVFVSLTASLLVIAGNRYFSRNVGGMAALLFSLANIQTVFAHEARVYPLFELLTLLSFVLCWEITRKGNLGHKVLIGLGLTDAVLLYSHYFSFWVLAIQALFLVSYFIRRKDRKIRVFLPFVWAFVFYIPNIGVFVTRLFDSVGHGTWVPEPTGIAMLYTFIWNLTNSPVGAVISLSLIAVAFFYLAYKRNLPDFATLAMISLLPMVLMYVASYKAPMFLDRYLLFTSPGFYLLLAYSVSVFPLWMKRVAFLGLSAVMLFTVTLNPSNNEDVRGLAEFLKTHKEAQTEVYVIPDWFSLNLGYYYAPGSFKKYNTEAIHQTIQTDLAGQSVYFVRDSAQISPTLDTAGTVMLVDYGGDFHYPGNGVKDFLKRHFEVTESRPFGKRINLWIYR